MRAGSGRLARAWRKLVAPPAQVTDVGERRAVELVAILLVLLFSLTGVAALFALGVDRPLLVSRLPVVAPLMLAYVGLYALNRTRHHRIAALLVCLGPIWSNLAVGFSAPDDPIWYGLIAAGPLLAAALLPFRAVVVLAALCVAGATAAVLVHLEAIGDGHAVLIIACVTLMDGVVVATAHLRARVERERRDEFRRITEQVAAAERLESIGRLAGGVAHDFNNLLTVIMANTDLARRGHGGTEVLDEVATAADRAAELVRQLLAFARRQPVAPRTVALDGLVHELVPLLRRLVPESIELDLSLDAGCAISADPGQIEQVLINLVANARDALPERGGRVRIATAREGADRVLLTVADNGAGMDGATRARAFEPFFTTKAVGEGTGLGLAMVHGIVRQAGGDVEIASEPGQGTEIRIALPRAHGEPDAQREGAPAAARVVLSGGVLLVEDDALVRRATEEVLREAGLTVVAACHPADVPRALAELDGQLHLVVTDVVMPGQSGIELAAELRAAHPGIAVVLMSGYAEENVSAAAALPDTRLVAKPFTPDELIAAVRTVLPGARSPHVA